MSRQNKPVHAPVLLDQVVDYLKPQRGGNFLDATIGYGGHAEAILERLHRSGQPYHFWGIDLDGQALQSSQKRLKKYRKQLTLTQSNFRDLVLLTRPVRFDGIALDLGVSSPQLKDRLAGFSFQRLSPLDMRYDRSRSPGKHTLTAWLVVNRWPLARLTQLFRGLGEEPYARSIALTIAKERSRQSIDTTAKLVDLVKQATPPAYRHSRHLHFATNVFRALRMAVNDEINNLQSFLKQLPQLVNPDCQVVIISFHSLEDRLVKNWFSHYQLTGQAQVITKKPIQPSKREISVNPRARSAKLRSIRWLG